MVTLAEALSVADGLTAAASDPRWSPEQQAAFATAEITARRLLGALYAGEGFLAEAHASYQRAMDLGGPGHLALRQALLIPRLPSSQADIVAARERLRTGLEALLTHPPTVSDPLHDMPVTGYLLAYHGTLPSLELQRLLHRVLSRMAPSLDWVAPHCQPPARRRPGLPRIGLPRIGFVSWHLNPHTIARLFLGLATSLDPGRFETTLFAFDGHNAALTTPHVILPANLEQARQGLAEAELDVLIYLDLGMDYLTLMLAHARLARLQGVLWGHPDSTGLATIDVFFTADCMEPAGAEAHYSERLVRLPGPSIIYDRPPAMPEAKRGDYGLPDSGVLLLCPQTLQKFHPDFTPLIQRILRAIPDGWLVLTPGPQTAGLEALLLRLCDNDPRLRERIIVLPPLTREAFLGLFEVCDMALDPLHYSGGNTSLEGLASGIPIITWPGHFMRARHTAGFYALMAVSDCVAADWDDYVALTVALAHDPARRQSLRQRLKVAAACLYGDRQGLCGLEDFLAAEIAQSPYQHDKI